MSQGFNVYDPIEIDNLDEVKQIKNIIPPTSDVRLAISRVKPEKNKDGDTAYLAVSFKIVDGILTPILDNKGEPTGEAELKYRGALATQYPQRFIYWMSPDKVQTKVNLAKKEKSKEWWKNKQYLLEFKQLLVACGIDPKLDEFKIDNRLQIDQLISALKDKELIGNITQKEDQAKVSDPETGEVSWKGVGTYQNEVKNLRRAS